MKSMNFMDSFFKIPFCQLHWLHASADKKQRFLSLHTLRHQLAAVFIEISSYWDESCFSVLVKDMATNQLQPIEFYDFYLAKLLVTCKEVKNGFSYT